MADGLGGTTYLPLGKYSEDVEEYYQSLKESNPEQGALLVIDDSTFRALLRQGGYNNKRYAIDFLITLADKIDGQIVLGEFASRFMLQGQSVALDVSGNVTSDPIEVTNRETNQNVTSSVLDIFSTARMDSDGTINMVDEKHPKLLLLQNMQGSELLHNVTALHEANQKDKISNKFDTPEASVNEAIYIAQNYEPKELGAPSRPVYLATENLKVLPRQFISGDLHSKSGAIGLMNLNGLMNQVLEGREAEFAKKHSEIFEEAVDDKTAVEFIKHVNDTELDGADSIDSDLAQFPASILVPEELEDGKSKARRIYVPLNRAIDGRLEKIQKRDQYEVKQHLAKRDEYRSALHDERVKALKRELERCINQEKLSYEGAPQNNEIILFDRSTTMELNTIIASGGFTLRQAFETLNILPGAEVIFSDIERNEYIEETYEEFAEKAAQAGKRLTLVSNDINLQKVLDGKIKRDEGKAKYLAKATLREFLFKLKRAECANTFADISKHFTKRDIRLDQPQTVLNQIVSYRNNKNLRKEFNQRPLKHLRGYQEYPDGYKGAYDGILIKEDIERKATSGFESTIAQGFKEIHDEYKTAFQLAAIEVTKSVSRKKYRGQRKKNLAELYEFFFILEENQVKGTQGQYVPNWAYNILKPSLGVGPATKGSGNNERELDTTRVEEITENTQGKVFYNNSLRDIEAEEPGKTVNPEDILKQTEPMTPVAPVIATTPETTTQENTNEDDMSQEEKQAIIQSAKVAIEKEAKRSFGRTVYVLKEKREITDNELADAMNALMDEKLEVDASKIKTWVFNEDLPNELEYDALKEILINQNDAIENKQDVLDELDNLYQTAKTKDLKNSGFGAKLYELRQKTNNLTNDKELTSKLNSMTPYIQDEGVPEKFTKEMIQDIIFGTGETPVTEGLVNLLTRALNSEDILHNAFANYQEEMAKAQNLSYEELMAGKNLKPDSLKKKPKISITELREKINELLPDHENLMQNTYNDGKELIKKSKVGFGRNAFEHKFKSLLRMPVSANTPVEEQKHRDVMVEMIVEQCSKGKGEERELRSLLHQLYERIEKEVEQINSVDGVAS
jgi:hypothetical protein